MTTEQALGQEAAVTRSRKWQSRALRAIGSLVGLVALLWALGWWWLPGWLKTQVETRGSAALGRELRIDAVRIEPWALTLAVEGVQLGAAPGSPAAEPQARIGRLFVDLDARSILERAPVIKALQIDRPQLRVARTGDGRYDIDDLLRRLAPEPAAAPAGEPARFAVFNVEIRDGALRFDDQPKAKVHELQALHLAVPFLSNLPHDLEVKVQPHLAFTFDGASFDTGGDATPFSQTRRAELTLAVKGFDLGAWRAYQPADLPLQVVAGRLDSDLRLHFAQPAQQPPQVGLAGQLTLSQVGLAPPTAAASAVAPVQWRQLTLGLTDVQPLARRVTLGALRVDGLTVAAERTASGALNLWPAPAAATATAKATPAEPSASSATSPATSAGSDWQVRLDQLQLADSRLTWRDETVKPAARLQAAALTLEVKQAQWPLPSPGAQPVALSLSTDLAAGDAAAPTGRVTLGGDADAKGMRLRSTLEALRLEALSPYLAGVLRPRVSGQVDAQAALTLAWAGEQPERRVLLDSVAVRDLRVDDAAISGKAVRDPALGWQSLTVSDSVIDLAAQKAALGRLVLTRPVVQVARDARGEINLVRWLATGDAAAPSGAKPRQPAVAAAKPTAPAWSVTLQDARLDGGRVQWRDAATATGTPVAVDATALNLAVQGVRWPAVDKPGSKAMPWKVKLAANLQRPADATQDRRAAPSRLDWQGALVPEPLRASGRLLVERVPVHAFEPYFGAGLPVSLLHAEAGWKGEFSVQQQRDGWLASAQGDALLGDVHVAPRQGGEELLAWQSLALQGLQVGMTPGQTPRVDLAEAALTDFYARLLVTEQGHFNFQDVGPATGAASAPTAGAAASAASPTVAVAAAPAASTASAPAEAFPLALVVGRTRLVNGKVDFTDHFIRPNYSAALTELNGSLGRIESNSPKLAALELRGKAAGTAPLEINGELNPATRPMALDLRARATDLELAPLSPYAGKYAGYAIERGKLTMDVAYKIQPNGQLDAKNQVILNQLTFGDRVDSPDATKLPVLLAVALLKDRNGVIDINLPVSGSINDPQFSVGGIVVKVIVNLLVKAITAPFALLAGGGSDELSFAEFQPGTAVLSDKGRGVVDKVAQALIDRPSLKMTVTGAADPQTERDAIQAAALEARIDTERRREQLRAGRVADGPQQALTAAERAALVKQIYGDTKLPNKPRNAIGLAKDLPVPEMEALLKTATPLNTDGARELALQRGLAVRDALVAKGLPAERLFLAAPKLHAAGEEDPKADGATPGPWTPRVQLTLSTQ